MDTTTTPVISAETMQNALTYQEYRDLMENLVEEKSTTGPNKSEDMAYYTALNHQRMKRLNKTVKLNPELENLIKQIDSPQTWILLTESWCGDAAQNVPVIHKLAELNEHITLKLLLRDENLEVMDQYLTNGGRSIPKLIIFDADNMKELGTWGPRPQELQGIYDAWRNDPDKVPYKEFNVTLQKWYAQDKTQSMQSELVALLK